MVFSRDLPHSFSEALRVARKILSSNHTLVAQARVESESELIVLGAHRLATGERLSRSDLYFRMKDRIPETSGEKVIVFSLKRAEGTPLQYVLGYATFLNHEYLVSPDVLIPRPETEILVNEALKILSRLKPSLGLEIGVGSGIISVELLSALGQLKMVGTEISSCAALVAKSNAQAILPEENRLSVLKSESAFDVMKPFVDEKIHDADFLISNPPISRPHPKRMRRRRARKRTKIRSFPGGFRPSLFL